MTLHRRLRGVNLPLYPSYDSLRFSGKNKKNLILKTQSQFQGEESWIDEEMLPSQIRLEARLKAVRFSLEKPPMASFVKEGKELGKKEIYDKKFSEFQHSGVSLIYNSRGYYFSLTHEWVPFEGISFEEIGLIFEKKDSLYHHSFVHQKGGLLRLEAEIKEKGHLKITPPGEIGGYPLWAYGGVFKPGCKIEDIEQAVFTITEDKGGTCIKISTVSQWRQKGLIFSKISKIGKRIVSPQDKEFSELRPWALKEAIEGGKATFFATLGKDQNGSDIVQPYDSSSIIKEDGSDKVTVTFRKRK